MTYSYNAGSTTPNLAGLAEWPGGGGVRINDGTFVLTAAPGLFDSSPPVRAPALDLPSDHGGYGGTPLYGARHFAIEGYLDVPTLADVEPAKDQLRGAFNLSNATFQTLTLNQSGWSATRQVQCRIDGPITFVEPHMLDKQVPQREFSIPLYAVDPLIYSSTTTSWNLEYTALLHGISNQGTFPTYFRVVFNGPVTNPSMVWTNGTVTRKITYTGTVGSGHYVQVDTNPTNGLTAVDDTGANVYGVSTSQAVSQFDLLTIPNGSTTNFHAEGSGYSTNVAVVTFRDAWA